MIDVGTLFLVGGVSFLTYVLGVFSGGSFISALDAWDKYQDNKLNRRRQKAIMELNEKVGR